MRRKDREITDIEKQLDVVKKCRICRIAMQDEYGLYIVPMNFGYKYENRKLVLYFHCAGKGRKIDALKKDPNVCVEMDCDHYLYAKNEDIACTYSFRFSSLIGTGTAYFAENREERITGLDAIMLHQTGRIPEYDEDMLKIVNVFRIELDDFTVKEHE